MEKIIATKIDGSYHKRYSSSYMSHPNGAGLSDSEYRVWDIADRLFRIQYKGNDVLVYSTTAEGLAAETGLSSVTVRNASQSLVKKGFLLKIKVRSVLYWITLDPTDKYYRHIINTVNAYNGHDISRDEAILAESDKTIKLDKLTALPVESFKWVHDRTIDLHVYDKREFDKPIAARLDGILWVKSFILRRFFPKYDFIEDSYVINDYKHEHYAKWIDNNKKQRDALSYYVNGLIKTEEHVECLQKTEY